MYAALRIISNLLFSVLLFSLSIRTVSGQTQYVQLISDGDAAYQVFDNETALKFYHQALDIDSTLFDTRLKLSRTSYDLGLDYIAEKKEVAAFEKFEESILHAQALVNQFPDSAQAHFMLAATSGNLALFKSGREKVLLGRMVEQHSRRAIALNPELAYPYVSLGIYYRELSSLNWIERALAKVFFGRLPEATIDHALELMNTALDLRPEFPFLHFELAMTFITLKQFDKALHHLETLVSLQPESSQDARNQTYALKLIEEIRPKVVDN